MAQLQGGSLILLNLLYYAAYIIIKFTKSQPYGLQRINYRLRQTVCLIHQASLEAETLTVLNDETRCLKSF